MEFSGADIRRIYGNLFFVLPEEEETPAEENTTLPTLPHTLFEKGGEVNWKMKPEAKLALILSKAEFSNRTLTTWLKEQILHAGIDTNFIGFGVGQDQEEYWNLTTMPVQVGLVFTHVGQSLPAQVQWEQRECFIVGKLADLSAQPDQLPTFQTLLQRVKFLSGT